MIGDADRTLRPLLRDALGLADEQIRFDRPDGQLARSADGKPALCLYLYDVRENRELRRADVTIERRSDGTAEVRQPPLRFDLSYLVTAWASDPEQEHELLGRALVVLLAHPVLDPELLQGSLREQALPVPTAVGRPDSLADPVALWSGLGGMRPAIFYTVTVPVSPYPPEERRTVRSRLLRVADKSPARPGPAEGSRVEESVDIAGKVTGADDQPVREAQVSLRETSRSSSVDSAGVYRLRGLAPGRYTLVVSAPGYRELRREVALTARAELTRLGGGLDVKLDPSR